MYVRMDFIAYVYRLLGFLSVAASGCFAASTTTTMTSTTVSANQTTTTANNGGGLSVNSVPSTTTVVYSDFFDDPHNQATYIVLPVMILIYGGCATIYCVAKCRKSCRKRKRRKQHEKLMEREEQEDQKHNTFDNMAYNEGEYKHSNIETPYELGATAAKPMFQRGMVKMGYNIHPLPTSTEDPVMNANIDTHLKNAFAMIEHAARDIKMQQALGMKSCPDRYPTEGENDGPLPKKGGLKRKYYIAM